MFPCTTLINLEKNESKISKDHDLHLGGLCCIFSQCSSSAMSQENWWLSRSILSFWEMILTKGITEGRQGNGNGWQGHV